MLSISRRVGKIRETHHVRELRQVLPDERIAIKHGPETGLLENLEFAAVEHLDLAAMCRHAGTLVSAHLEHTRAVLRCRRGNGQFRMAFKGDQERALDAQIGRLFGGSPEKCFARFAIFIVARKVRFGIHERLESGRRNQDVDGRCFRPQVEVERAYGLHAEPVQCGNERLFEILVGGFSGGPRLQSDSGEARSIPAPRCSAPLFVRLKRPPRPGMKRETDVFACSFGGSRTAQAAQVRIS